MSPAEFVLYPLACALVYVVGYSLSFEKLTILPFLFAVPSIITGLMTGDERLSVYVFVGTIVVSAAMALLGTAVLVSAAKKMEETK